MNLMMRGDGEWQHSMVVGYLTMIVGLTAVYLGIKSYRDKVQGGVIKFLPALLVGLGISAVAGVIYVIAWEISLATMDVDFAASYSKGMIDAARARGATGAQLEEVIASAAAFVATYRNPFLRMGITFLEIFPVGILVSLISAALLRRTPGTLARSST
jgi:hypothetical protein